MLIENMKTLTIMSVLPLMAVACVQWELGGGKIFYVGLSYNMLQIMGDDHHDRLYQQEYRYKTFGMYDEEGEH